MASPSSKRPHASRDLERAALAALIVAALLALFAGAKSVVGVPAGLTGTYYRTIDWTGTPALSAVDAPPSADAILEAWNNEPPETFSARWTGSFVTLRGATRTFGVRSDDGAWVYVDGTLVADNGGRHSSQLATGTIALERGVHRIFIRYFQAGGSSDFELSWGSDAQHLRPMPAWALSPRRPPFALFVSAVVIAWIVTALQWLLAVTLIAAFVVGIRSGPDAPGDSESSRTRHRAIRASGVFVAVAAAAALYVYVATAGLFPTWPPSETHFYSQQADGFLSGHTSLDVDARLRYWDASLYNGRYFIYWGPVPALLVAAAKLVVGTTKNIPDSRVVVWFSVALLGCKLLLLRLVGSRLYPDLRSRWAIPIAFAVLAVGAPQLYLLARPAIYEAAIMGAQCFLLAGVCAAFFGMAPDASPRRRTASCLAAGLFWALAIGCRAPAIVAVAILAPITAPAYGLGYDRGGVHPALKRAAAPFAAVSSPIAVGSLALGVFNKIRFDSWTEFGTSYQLTNIRPSWTGRFVLPNLYSYIARPPRLSCAFPFISSSSGPGAFPAHFSLPSGYIVSEPVVGLLWVAPWLLFSIVALGLLCAWLAGRAPQRTSSASSKAAVSWLAFSGLALTAAGGIVMLGMPLATMRYGGDVATGVSLLAVIGYLWTLRRLQEGHRILYRTVATASALLAAYTVVVGVLLGAEGYYGQFKRNNPVVYNALARSLSGPGCRWE